METRMTRKRKQHVDMVVKNNNDKAGTIILIQLLIIFVIHNDKTYQDNEENKVIESKKQMIELQATLQDQQSQINKKLLQLKDTRIELDRTNKLILMMTDQLSNAYK